MHVFCAPDMELGPESTAFESDVEPNSDGERGKRQLTKNGIIGETRQCGNIVIGRLHETGRESRQF